MKKCILIYGISFNARGNILGAINIVLNNLM